MPRVGEIWATDCMSTPARPTEPLRRSVCTTSTASGVPVITPGGRGAESSIATAASTRGRINDPDIQLNIIGVHFHIFDVQCQLMCANSCALPVDLYCENFHELSGQARWPSPWRPGHSGRRRLEGAKGPGRWAS